MSAELAHSPIAPSGRLNSPVNSLSPAVGDVLPLMSLSHLVILTGPYQQASNIPLLQLLTCCHALLQTWQHVMDYTAAALLLCNVHRNTFSVLLPQISSQLALSPSQAGQIQAGNLLAYLLGQLPSGRLADTLGGTR